MSDPVAGPPPIAPLRPRLAYRAMHHRPPLNDDLEKHKGTVRRLYLDDGLTLREVMGLMETQYGVKASYDYFRAYIDT